MLSTERQTAETAGVLFAQLDMRLVPGRADAVMRQAIASHGGRLHDAPGAAYFATFHETPHALDAAHAIYAGFARDARLRRETAVLRAAVDGIPRTSAGLDQLLVSGKRAARLAQAAHGGQILVSARAAAGASRAPDVWSLRDLGWHRSQALSPPERVYQLVTPDVRSEFPPLRALPAPPHNLRAHPSRFVGRHAEMEALRATLGRARLITLVGIGGVGKTRLAVQAAAELLTGYPDGVWFADLADRTSYDDVCRAVAALWRIEDGGVPDRPVAIESLRDAHLLLILDNCEQAVRPVARFADALLAACPAVRVLATSRQPLGIDGEHVFRVKPLAGPDLTESTSAADALAFPAVELFADRARAAGVTLAPDDAPAAARIVRQLAGIPLAIELAAPRLRAYSLADLETLLAGQLHALRHDGAVVPPRHRTMRALIEWSHALLDAGERHLLEQMAVFAGSCSLEALAAVAGPDRRPSTFELLESLVDKSLVEVSECRGRRRYQLLEPIRRFVLERLQKGGRTFVARDAHARYFAALATRVEPAMDSSSEDAWYSEFGGDADNFREALDWSTPREPALAAQTAAALAMYWKQLAACSEGLDRSESVLSALGGRANEDAAAPLWLGVALLAFECRAIPRALQAAAASVRLAARAGDDATGAKALAVQTAARLWSGDRSLSQRAIDRAAHRCRSLGRWADMLLSALVRHHMVRSEFEEAQTILREQSANPRAQRWPGRRNLIDMNLAECLFALGDVRGAIDRARCVADRSHAGDLRSRAASYCNLASFFAVSGDSANAAAYARRALDLPRPAQDAAFEPFVLQTVALIAATRGLHDAGAELLGYVDGALGRLRLERDPAERIVFARLSAAIAGMPAVERTRRRQAGAVLSEDAARALASHVLTTSAAVCARPRPLLELLQERLRIGNADVPLTGQELGLLALIAAAKHPVAVPEICDALWASSSIRAARAALHCCLYRLRKKAGQTLIVQAGEAYEIGDGIDVDLRQLRRAVKALHGKLEPLSRDVDRLSSMFAALRNRRMVRLTRYDWHAQTEAELVGMLKDVAKPLLAELMRRGDLDAATTRARELLADDPCDDLAVEYCVRAHLSAGDQAAAQAAFSRYRDALAREFGEPPAPHIRALLGAGTSSA